MNPDMPELTDIERIASSLDILEWLLDELKIVPGGSRGRSIAMTKMQEAYYWLGLGLAEEEHKPTHE